MTHRTPQPCRHKIANHTHGTRACYVLDRCRCQPCTDANRTTQATRRREQLYGRYDAWADADPVREHLAFLAANGMGRRRIAAVSGVNSNVLFKLIHGTKRPDGSRTPSRRIARANAEKLLAVRVDRAPNQPADEALTAGATKRIRALVALGWSLGALADRFGSERVRLIAQGSVVISIDTARRVQALYEELSMSLPPQRDRFEKGSVTRARKFATQRGWVPPLALDDELLDTAYDGELLDDDLEVDLFDEQAIYRRMHGDKDVRLTKAEKFELRRRWAAAGRSGAELERITGLNPHRYADEQAAS